MGKKQKERPTGDCKLCLAKSIEFSKSDIVPQWFIKLFKEGPDGGHYVDALGTGPDGEFGRPGIAYFYDYEVLCTPCNNERFGALEGTAKDFYNNYLADKAPYDYGPDFYAFATSISWRVLTFLQRVGTDRTILDDPHVAEALECWRQFLTTCEPHHIRGHSQHIFLSDPNYAGGLTQAFRFYDVVRLTDETDRQLLDILEQLVGCYRPTDVYHVSAAKADLRQVKRGNDVLVLTFFGCFTLIGVVHTDDPDRWKGCGRLAVNGGRLDAANGVTARMLLAMVNQDLGMWYRLYKQGNQVGADNLYFKMIEPFAAAICGALRR